MPGHGGKCAILDVTNKIVCLIFSHLHGYNHSDIVYVY